MDTDKTPGKNLDETKCWTHKKKYLGKYKSHAMVGRVFDQDHQYTFENGVVTGVGLKFTETACVPSLKKGGKRNTKKRIGRKRSSRSKRN